MYYAPVMLTRTSAAPEPIPLATSTVLFRAVGAANFRLLKKDTGASTQPSSANNFVPKVYAWL